jgi:hypothetical protein
MTEVANRRSILAGLIAAAGLALPATLTAQELVVDPSGEPASDTDVGDVGDANGAAEESGPPRPYATAPGRDDTGRATASARSAAAAGQQESSGVPGYYHRDDHGGDDVDRDPGLEGAGGPSPGGPVPAVHVVRSGDTLWDLSASYFSSPWEWPKVWSYNPEVTNPHWIYPGNQLRLHAAGDGPASAAGAVAGGAGAAGGGGGGTADKSAGRRTDSGAFELRQLAFVDLDDLRYAGKIDGSPEEKQMLARGDEAYVAYPPSAPPKVGQKHSIYQKQRDVVHPETGKVVGAYVKVVGEIEILSVKKDKRARAIINDSVDPIERGDLVGSLRQRYVAIAPTAAKADVQATIIGLIGADQLIGARQVVFIDRGKADGILPGNRMYAVRRGDAYAEVMAPGANLGNNDRRYPARALGELLVVETGKRTSLAVVTMSVQELGIGDHVVLSRAIN